ncbi:MAG TPA: dienelactone hydrolase family protein [Gemmatimonadales bacterium]|jgi:alpha-beta hydrolase superfamily lysophospholipase
MTSTITAVHEWTVLIPAGAVRLSGTLATPVHPSGAVIFAHGSGSGRLSPRNRFVAQQLNLAGLATLLFDLLTEGESADRANVFDIDLLANRLLAAQQWLRIQQGMTALPIGYFGASTGAAAALKAAAKLPSGIGAVVSRGGRPDLAGENLPLVRAPTLLIVGSRDTAVLDLNRDALARLTCPKRLTVVPGATHLFEEPGTLEEVATLAARWFVAHLGTEPPRDRGRP